MVLLIQTHCFTAFKPFNIFQTNKQRHGTSDKNEWKAQGAPLHCSTVKHPPTHTCSGTPSHKGQSLKATAPSALVTSHSPWGSLCFSCCWGPEGSGEAGGSGACPLWSQPPSPAPPSTLSRCGWPGSGTGSLHPQRLTRQGHQEDHLGSCSPHGHGHPRGALRWAEGPRELFGMNFVFCSTHPRMLFFTLCQVRALSFLFPSFLLLFSSFSLSSFFLPSTLFLL